MASCAATKSPDWPETPSRPPGLSTRANSRSASGWSRTQCSVELQYTASKLPVANRERSSAVPTKKDSLAPVPLLSPGLVILARARSMRSSLGSTPTTSPLAPTTSARYDVMLPGPHPTSRTRMPGSSPSCFRRKRPASYCVLLTAV
ncbi:hypothetical protein ACKVWC_011549 [Pyricularia oryzae]